MNLDKLTNLHQSTTPGPWQAGNSYIHDNCYAAIDSPQHSAIMELVVKMEYQEEPCDDLLANVDFVLTAHEVWPQIMHRLQRADRMEKALEALLLNINKDKDNSYFLCAEAHDVIINANIALMVDDCSTAL